MIKTLPFIGKELIELAGRRLTYLLRMNYAVVIILFFYWTYRGLSLSPDNFITGLGVGAELYNTLLITQFVLILLVVPPLVATAITSEKENKTIHLILTLPVSSLSYLLQKLAGRLIPIISLILVSGPLFGLSLVMGGVTTRMVIFGTLNSILTAISVGTLALAISCIRDTSARATIETYLYLLVLAPSCLSPIIITSSASGFGPFAFAFMISSVFSIVGLTAARHYFRHRAMVNPESEPATERTGKILRKVYTTRWGLPDEQPLTWLELIKFPMNHREYASVSFLIVLAIFGLGLGTQGELTCLKAMPMIMAFMALATLFRAQHALRKFSQNQFLPSLLTAPLSVATLIKQLADGRRYGIHQAMIGILLLCIGLWIQTLMEDHQVTQTTFSNLLVVLVIMPAICMFYLMTLLWFGLYTALISRTGLQATAWGVGAFSILTIIAPLLLSVSLLREAHWSAAWLPAYAFNILFDHFLWPEHDKPFAALGPLIFHAAIWFGLWASLQRVCLRHAETLLRRHL